MIPCSAFALAAQWYYFYFLVELIRAPGMVYNPCL